MSASQENEIEEEGGGGVAALRARFNQPQIQTGPPARPTTAKPPKSSNPKPAPKPNLPRKPATLANKPTIQQKPPYTKPEFSISKPAQPSVSISELQQAFKKAKKVTTDNDESYSSNVPKEPCARPPQLAPKKIIMIENKENTPIGNKPKELCKAPVPLPSSGTPSKPTHNLPETVVLPSGKKLRLRALPEDSGPPPPVPERPPGMVLPDLKDICTPSPEQDEKEKKEEEEVDDEDDELYDDVSADVVEEAVRPHSLIPELASDEEEEAEEGEDDEIYDEVEGPSTSGIQAKKEEEEEEEEGEDEEMYEYLEDVVDYSNTKELKKLEKTKKKEEEKRDKERKKKKVPTATLR